MERLKNKILTSQMSFLPTALFSGYGHQEMRGQVAICMRTMFYATQGGHLEALTGVRECSSYNLVFTRVRSLDKLSFAAP